jgi:hypothetical protein
MTCPPEADLLGVGAGAKGISQQLCEYREGSAQRGCSSMSGLTLSISGGAERLPLMLLFGGCYVAS